MKVLKKINNNVALAQDSEGTDIVVFGRGVGFPEMPYELTDLTKIQRTFYAVNAKYLSMAVDLPEELLLISADIAEMAAFELGCDLNPNLPFTLADHLNFAIERIKKGIALRTPLAYDIAHLYPQEMRLGEMVLDMLREKLFIEMPASEAVSVALHLITNEAETGNIRQTLRMTNILNDVITIIEKELTLILDKQSFNYSRFIMHLRYLVERLVNGKQVEGGVGTMLHKLKAEYPDIYLCTKAVTAYLEKTQGWHCNEEEMFYLFIHINRVKEGNDR